MTQTRKSNFFSRFSRFWSRTILIKWLAGDVFYAVLPLLMLSAITALVGRPFHEFAELKEWSFAAIVFWGVTIRRFVRVKAELQKNSNPQELYTGLELLLFGLVASVLVLSLVLLKEMGELPGRDLAYLGHVQVTLFATALFSLLISVRAEEPDNGGTTSLPAISR
jgi:hypothetical protein